jgi:hypothetical protein
MKKLPQFILVIGLCLLTLVFFFWSAFWFSNKLEPKSNTYTRSPSVACSADGKTVYWISNDTDNNVVMYKSEDGGKTWTTINPYYETYTDFYGDLTLEDTPTKAVPIPRNGK